MKPWEVIVASGAILKGRRWFWSPGKRKITPKLESAIKTAYGSASERKLARRFRVSQSTVSKIGRGVYEHPAIYQKAVRPRFTRCRAKSK